MEPTLASCIHVEKVSTPAKDVCCFHPTAARVFICRNRVIYDCDIDSGARVIMGKTTSSISRICHSFNYHYLAVACEDGSLWLWDSQLCRCLSVVPYGKKSIGHPVNLFTFACDGPPRLFMERDGGRGVIGMDVRPGGGAPLLKFDCGKSPIHRFALHPHRPLLAIATQNGVIYVWNTTTGSLQCVLAESDVDVVGLSFAPERLEDAEILVVASSDRRLFVWDSSGATSGKLLLISNLMGLKENVTLRDLSFFNVPGLPEGQCLMGSLDSTGIMSLWDVHDPSASGFFHPSRIGAVASFDTIESRSQSMFRAAESNGLAVSTMVPPLEVRRTAIQLLVHPRRNLMMPLFQQHRCAHMFVYSLTDPVEPLLSFPLVAPCQPPAVMFTGASVPLLNEKWRWPEHLYFVNQNAVMGYSLARGKVETNRIALPSLSSLRILRFIHAFPRGRAFLLVVESDEPPVEGEPPHHRIRHVVLLRPRAEPVLIEGRDAAVLGPNQERFLVVSLHGNAISVHRAADGHVEHAGHSGETRGSIPKGRLGRVFSSALGEKSAVVYRDTERHVLVHSRNWKELEEEEGTSTAAAYYPDFEHRLYLRRSEVVMSIHWLAHPEGSPGSLMAVMTSSRLLVTSADLSIVTQYVAPPRSRVPYFVSCQWVGPVLLFTAGAEGRVRFLSLDGKVHDLCHVGRDAVISTVMHDRLMYAYRSPQGGIGTCMGYQAVGLFEPLILGVLAQPEDWYLRKDVVYRALGVFCEKYGNQRISPRLLKILDEHGHSDLALVLASGVQHIEPYLRIGFAIRAHQFETALSSLMAVHQASPDHPQIDPTNYPLIRSLEWLGNVALHCGQLEVARRCFNTLGNDWAVFWMCLESHNRPGIQVLLDQLQFREGDEKEEEKGESQEEDEWDSVFGDRIAAIQKDTQPKKSMDPMDWQRHQLKTLCSHVLKSHQKWFTDTSSKLHSWSFQSCFRRHWSLYESVSAESRITMEVKESVRVVPLKPVPVDALAGWLPAHVDQPPVRFARSKGSSSHDDGTSSVGGSSRRPDSVSEVGDYGESGFGGSRPPTTGSEGPRVKGWLQGSNEAMLPSNDTPPLPVPTLHMRIGSSRPRSATTSRLPPPPVGILSREEMKQVKREPATTDQVPSASLPPTPPPPDPSYAVVVFRSGQKAMESEQFTKGIELMSKAVAQLTGNGEKKHLGESQVRQQIRLCVFYKLAMNILIEIGQLHGQEEDVERLALLTRFLADIPLHGRHRVVCMRMAIGKNLKAKNYGIAGRLMKVLMERSPPDKEQLERRMVVAREHDFMDNALPPYVCPKCDVSTSVGSVRCPSCSNPVRICFDTLQVLQDKDIVVCSQCVASFSTSVIKDVEGKCPMCQVSVLKIVHLSS